MDEHLVIKKSDIKVHLVYLQLNNIQFILQGAKVGKRMHIRKFSRNKNLLSECFCKNNRAFVWQNDIIVLNLQRKKKKDDSEQQ